MTQAAYREAAVYHEQALVALRHLPEPARRWSSTSISTSTCARRS